MSHELRKFDLSGVQGLSKKAIDLHLGLYKTYVEQFNKLMEQDPQNTANASPLALDGYARRFAFEYNGVVLHELFFEALTGKNSSRKEDGGFSEAVSEAFGDFDSWKSAVSNLAKTRGVGWVLTVRDRATRRLYNCWIDLHQLSVPANSEVMFALDLWEHAFMIDFTPAQRADYVKVIFDNIDWSVIDARCPAVKSVEHA